MILKEVKNKTGKKNYSPNYLQKIFRQKNMTIAIKTVLSVLVLQ